MRLGLRALVPKTLASRFLLLLAAALIFANLVALALLGSERSRFAREARWGLQVERVAAVLPALQRVPDDLRDNIARAAATASLRLSVDRRPDVSRTTGGWRAQALRERFVDALEEDEADVRVAISTEHHGERRWPRWRAPRKVDVSVALAGGEWLNIRRRGDRPVAPLVGGAVFFALILSLLSVLAVGALFIRRITRPLNALAAAARRAGDGDRSARLAESGAREVRSAAAAFNAMQARIEAFDAERARTVAAVGHDLRTPITSLRIRAEMLDEEAREPIVRTLDEMGVMADGLLQWGRAGADAEPRAPFDLAEVLKNLCEGREGVVYEGPPQAQVSGRRVALARAFGNIVENAVRYAASARVCLSIDDRVATVTVIDDGPGIPEPELATVVEPFTRLEQSRSAETGGAGLGLSIARTILLAHGGALSLRNRTDGTGLIVEATLPLVSDANG